MLLVQNHWLHRAQGPKSAKLEHSCSGIFYQEPFRRKVADKVRRGDTVETARSVEFERNVVDAKSTYPKRKNW